MHPVEKYLTDLSEIGRTGGATAETSFYPPFESLLNEIGSKLNPRVRAVSQIRGTQEGSPDFGFYTANQYQNVTEDDLVVQAIVPERGVVEAKPWTDDSFATSTGAQVTKYWQRYGLVLVTNYRDFVLIGRDDSDRPKRLETYRMAGSEAEFRELLKHPRRTADDQGARFVEFLIRVLRHRAPLTDPEAVAWFLASYAREARCRIEKKADLPALESLKKGLEEALGMKFEGEKGDHFFRATLVQTLFYGVFSSWVLWCREHRGRPGARFNWHEAGWTLHVPMVAGLFSQIATPQKLKPLGVDEVLDWAGDVLNRVEQAAFFQKFEEEHAVQYFYEPFLKAYDPELRKELGVWYTPPEIVQYQVERVDRILREELDIVDGLADRRVIILDPCCGTGAYLVEVLKRIAEEYKDTSGALTAAKVRRDAIERVFGFEILPAPYVIAHLQIGLLLSRLGLPFNAERNERASIYMTNALTGWEPIKKPKDELPLFPELIEERDAANKVKQEAPILVILGNPPYNGFAGLAVDEERDLVTAYRETKRAPKPEGQGLNDLYVRFLRMAERRIVEKTGKGVICFISNYSWLEGLSHTGMRERYLEVFDKIWIDCLNGDKYKTGKLTPWGEPDPSIFSMESNREGIQVGTAISLFVRKSKVMSVGPAPSPVVQFPSARPAPAHFHRHLPHFEGRGDSLFITFSTDNRIKLPDNARRKILDHILHEHLKKMAVVCTVVMPDHVHMLYYPWADSDGRRYTKTEIVGSIKSVSSHSINKLLGRKGPVWQEESFDHVVRNAESFEEKVQYILENPVRNGLCHFPDEYPFLWRSWVEGKDCVGQSPLAVKLEARIGKKFGVGPAPSPVIASPDGMTGEGAGPTQALALILFRHLWGKSKHAEILGNATGEKEAVYEELKPNAEIGYPFMPAQVDSGYLTWPTLPELFPVSFPGVQTCRDEFLVDINRKELEERIAAYFNPSLSHQEIARRWPMIMEKSARYDAHKTRDYLVHRGPTKGRIVRYVYRPFDVRWLYWEPETKLLDEKRSDYFPQVFEGNMAISAAQHHRRNFDPPIFICNLGSRHLYERGANLFPLFLKDSPNSNDFFSNIDRSPTQNLSDSSRAFLATLDAEPFDLFFHSLALFFSKNYIRQNVFILRQDWPRIPLPAKKQALLDSTALGRRVAALLDTEKPLGTAANGGIPSVPFNIGRISKTGGGNLNPNSGDFDLTIGWGHGGKDGVCMPGRGKIETRKQTDTLLKRAFGEETLDIYLNGSAYWANVPPAVWDYTIGGYQVIKKWLSYREKTVLGRGLTMEETEYVTEMIRRIAALILLQPELDKNYETVKSDVWPWPDAQ